MSYKTIVVQLDTSERTPARIDCALHLATHFRAHLSGVFSDFTLDPRFYYEPSSAKRYRKSLEKTCMDRRAEIETLFRSGLPKRTWRVVGSPGKRTGPYHFLAMRAART